MTIPERDASAAAITHATNKVTDHQLPPLQEALQQPPGACITLTDLRFGMDFVCQRLRSLSVLANYPVIADRSGFPLGMTTRG